MLDKLWLRMASRYGHSWTSQFGVTPSGFAGAEWSETLAGLSMDDIDLGFSCDVLRGSEWPPSSTSFRAMCLDIPALADIRREINTREGARSPFGLMVSQELDRWQYKRAEYDKAEKLLKEAYDAARARVIAGEELPTTLVAIEPPAPEKPAPADPEVAEAAIRKLKELLNETD